jgi:sulfite dehydrogenase (quinone) subunit SoeC
VHPSFSIIFFTTLSGAGYGLLAFLGIYGALGLLPHNPAFTFVAMVLAFGAIGAGLLSSMLHLGRPERAWRALSQWQSSWLSREGIASIVTFLPALIFGYGWLRSNSGGIFVASGVASAVCSVFTVICTAYIYRSLKPVPNWHNRWVVPNYLTLAAMTGALLLAMLSGFSGYGLPGVLTVALTTVVVALVCKLAYWWNIDHAQPVSTPESATGLGALGTVRQLDAPHTSENYLLKEMGFHIARKHARKLRMIAVVLAFVLPLALTLATLLVPDVLAAVCLFAAVASAFAGVLTERWLFFGEAKHVVTLFYGQRLESA